MKVGIHTFKATKHKNAVMVGTRNVMTVASDISKYESESGWNCQRKVFLRNADRHIQKETTLTV